MDTRRFEIGLIVVAIAAMASVARAQAVASQGSAVFINRGGGAQVLESQVVTVAPNDDVPSIESAPFSAEATTEFTQMLSDGNRIERKYSTSLARDSKGRTRREQDIALIGPLSVLEHGLIPHAGRALDTASPAEPPRIVVISDPVGGATYTLDAGAKVARKGMLRAGGGGRQLQFSFSASAGPSTVPAIGFAAQPLEGQVLGDVFERAVAPPDARVEKLGTAEIEGVRAEGTRMTTTIPAGALGNLQPIDVVTERWYSPELQMSVRITRRDPRSGETVYRLTNLVRTEPPADLFAVPPDYEVRDATADFIKLREIWNQATPAR